MTSTTLTLAVAACLGKPAVAADRQPAAPFAAVRADPVHIAAAAPDAKPASKRDGGAQVKARTAPTKKTAKARAVKRSFRGKASWYGGKRFHGRRTASGEVFSANRPSAAHPTLPLGTEVRVTNLKNDRSTVLEVNDRLPPGSKHVIDLSRAAAKKLDFVDEGSVPVRVDVLKTDSRRLGSSGD